MFKSNLNRQFHALPEQVFNLLKMSAFGIVWNLIFHSLILSLLVYWSFTARNGNFNQFWTENQLLLATLCQGAMFLFFRDNMRKTLKFTPLASKEFFAFLIRGVFFTLLMLSGLVLSKSYDFLGFTAQANLTFFSSYAWVFRAFILLIFIFCTELYIHGIVIPSLPRALAPHWKTSIAALTLLAFYSIWFELSMGEGLTLLLLCVLFDQFWAACGFISAFFILTHAVLSLPWMGNEFSGLAQIKINAFEGRFLEDRALQITLFVLIIAFKGIPFYYSKRKPEEIQNEHRTIP